MRVSCDGSLFSRLKGGIERTPWGREVLPLRRVSCGVERLSAGVQIGLESVSDVEGVSGYSRQLVGLFAGFSHAVG